MTLKYTDWDVSEEHARLINELWPDGVTVRRPELRKSVQGLTGKRVGDGIRSGMWMKPLGSQPGRTWSGIRDVARKTLVVFVSGSTTGQSVEATDYEKVRDMIRDRFQDRRATCLDGEMFSTASAGDYDIDDAISRKYDIDMMEITTILREDR